MFARFAHLLLIVALLGATGTHWVMLQTVAWASMLADNARTAPISAAFEKTFDGKHPCALCKQIAQGKQSERKSDVQTELKQLEFLNAPVVLALWSPGQFRSLPAQNFSAPLVAETPPVPPPRDLAA
ncbi:MAG: hypothetical protein JWR69_3613 [Pedosphaera sp.]|nr:hypothetical protein [Pedosphaera sp.]